MAELRKLLGADAIAAYAPTEGQNVTIYTYKFKPERYSEGVELATHEFLEAELSARQKRYNIFLRHPSTHELVNVSFFDDGADVAEWHKSEERKKILERVRPLLEAPIDVQVYEVEAVSGVG